MTSRHFPAVDSHAHVFGPGYNFVSSGSYVPHPSQCGTVQQFLAVLDAHRIGYGLLIAAQPFGYDNSCMLDAIAHSDGRLKGIALVDPALKPAQWERLADGGIMGMRINLSTFGISELTHPDAQRLFAFGREAGWFLQVHCRGDELVAAASLMQATGLRIMVDHFGRPDLSRGLAQQGFQTLLRLGRDSDAIVKLSGPFRTSRDDAPYRDVDPYIEAAIDAFTLDRCVWGSDWPFVPGDVRVDYGPNFTCLERWVPSEAERRRVLWKNPALLFGFV